MLDVQVATVGIERLEQSAPLVEARAGDAVEQAQVAHSWSARQVQGPMGGTQVFRAFVGTRRGAVFEADVGRQMVIGPLEAANDRAKRRPFGSPGEAGVNLVQLMLHGFDELDRADQG